MPVDRNDVDELDPEVAPALEEEVHRLEVAADSVVALARVGQRLAQIGRTSAVWANAAGSGPVRRTAGVSRRRLDKEVNNDSLLC